MKKICVITGTRADYGLLQWVMSGISDSKVLELQIIATGSHLSPEFGLTYRELEADGFKINRKVEMLLGSDTPVGTTKSIGLGVISFADALNELQPDLVLLLGDRYEIFSAAVAAMIAQIPIAHIHGGESTEGAFDEALRHSITKMSHWHFVAAKPYQKRVMQLGESPSNVFLVGGLGIDNILKLNLLNKPELEVSLDFKFGQKNLLITFHPVTLEKNTAEKQTAELLAALSVLIDTNLIFTMPNADTESRIIYEMIKNYVRTRKNTKLFTSLGQLRYLSAIKYCDAVVGNSSSGIIEVPSLKKGTINIGDRQKGRLKANSIIDCSPEKESILSAIASIYSDEFQNSLKSTVNPYGNGGASEKIVFMLEQGKFMKTQKKSFHDVNFL